MSKRIDRFDPRVRIGVTVALASVVVLSSRIDGLLLGLSFAIAAAMAAGLDAKQTLRRLAAMDLFVLVMIATLPFTTPGTPLFTVGPLVGSEEGMVRALEIALKANAVMLLVLALVGTMDAVTLGHALHRLGVPDRLVHVLLFTVRYRAVIGCEYKRMRNAMKARAFRLRSTVHTWRSLGYLVGMLLVRSVDRAQRIMNAMKCRGYTGRLPVIDAFAIGRRDIALLVGGLAAAAGLAVLDWT